MMANMDEPRMTVRRAAWTAVLQCASLAIVCPIVKKPAWAIPIIGLGIAHVVFVWIQEYSAPPNQPPIDE
jgi:hypothetical protein